MEEKFCLKSRKELDEIRKQKAEVKNQISEISDETVYSAVAKAQDKALKSLRKDPDKRNFLHDADKLNNIYNAGLRREWRKKGLKNPVGMSAKQLGKVWDKDYEPVKNEYERQLKKRHKVDAFGNDKKQVDEGAGSAVIFEFEKADFNIPRVEDKQVIAEVEDLTLASAYDRREAPNGGFIVFDLDQVKAATVKTYNVNDRLVDEPELAVEDIADVKYVSVEHMPNLSYSWGWSRIELPKDVVLTWDKHQANYYMPELEVIFTDKVGEEYRVNSVNVDGEYHISEDVYYAYQDLDNYEDEEYDESLTAEKALAKSKTILEEYDESLSEAKVKPETLKAQLEEEIKKFFKYEPDALDWAFVEITKEEGRTRVEVRAELDYNGMWALSDALDPIVQKYDKDAYFEQEQPGIMTAYIENKKGLGERNIRSHRRKAIAEAKSKKMPKGDLILKLVHQVTKNDKGESAHVKYDWDKKEYNIEDQDTGEIIVSGKPNAIIKWAESKGAKQPAKEPGFAIDGAETLDQVYTRNWNRAMSKMAKNESKINENDGWKTSYFEADSTITKFPKTLSNLLRKCWYDGNGRYASIGKWEIGLGGYDHGYEVEYMHQPIFRITPDNEVEMYKSDVDMKLTCGYNYAQIMSALKQVQPNLELMIDDDDIEEESMYDYELEHTNESMFNKYGEEVDPKEWENKEARGLNEAKSNEVNIFLTNLGKYNEGELVGEWVELPVDDFQPILDRIGINDEYEEWFITDYEAPFEINEYDNIEELNDIAREIQDFDSTQLEVLDAYKENGYDMRDAIDKVIENDYFYLEGNTEEDLAYSYIDAVGGFEDAVSKEDKQYYFDYEAYGRDLVLGGDYSYVDDAVDLNSFADKDTAEMIFGSYGEDLPSEDDIAKYKKWIEIYNDYTDEQEEELAKQGIEVFMSSIYVDEVAYDVETLEQVVGEDYEVQSGYKDYEGNIVNVSSEKELAEYVIDDMLGGVDQMSEDEIERYFDYAWWGKTLAYDFYKTDNGWVQLD